jgi:hypothetical protein
MKIHRFLWIDDNPFPAKLWLIEIDTETINLNDNTLTLTFSNPFDKILKLSKRVDEIIILIY